MCGEPVEDIQGLGRHEECYRKVNYVWMQRAPARVNLSGIKMIIQRLKAYSCVAGLSPLVLVEAELIFGLYVGILDGFGKCF